jgi:hypothetical protein
VARLKDAEAVAAGKACWVLTLDPELCEAAQQLFDRAMAKADSGTVERARDGCA